MNIKLMTVFTLAIFLLTFILSACGETSKVSESSITQSSTEDTITTIQTTTVESTIVSSEETTASTTVQTTSATEKQPVATTAKAETAMTQDTTAPSPPVKQVASRTKLDAQSHAVGTWKACGFISKDTRLSTIEAYNPNTKSDINLFFKTITIKNDGTCIYERTDETFAGTWKGDILNPFGKYYIYSIDSKKYMFMTFENGDGSNLYVFVQSSTAPSPPVKQVASRTKLDAQSHAVGTWKACGFISKDTRLSTIEAYNPNTKSDINLFFKTITIKNDGTCTYERTDETFEGTWNNDNLTEFGKYYIYSIDGKKYMFMTFENGDGSNLYVFVQS